MGVVRPLIADRLCVCVSGRRSGSSQSQYNKHDAWLVHGVAAISHHEKGVVCAVMFGLTSGAEHEAVRHVQ